MNWLETAIAQGRTLNARLNTARRMQPPPVPAPKVREWKHLSPRQLQGMRNLLFCAKTIVEGAYSGRHRSPYKGASPEFVDYREYNPGDELRSIDWKAVARTDRLLVRLYEKQTDLNCHLMVDASGSMAYGGKESKAGYLDHNTISKMDYAFCLAASLAYLMIKQGDKAGLTIFAREIRHHAAPGGTFAHLYGMLNAMERQMACDRTQVADVLRKAFAMCRRRGLLIVFSDLLEAEGSDLFNALSLYRHRGFEIILFHILHPHELTLPPEAAVNFIDAETSEMISTHPGEIVESYREQVNAWINDLRTGAQARRIDYRLVRTDTPYETVLGEYLLRRSRL